MKKKFLFFLILLLLSTNFVYAKNKQIVELSRCVDGDTARFILNNEEIVARFLAIDTPETKHPNKKEEYYGQEASDYTCKRLSNGKVIEIAYEDNSDIEDRYGRHLVWVYVDNNLIQEELISEGYAKVAYIYGNYKYTSLLESKENIAKFKKIGIWKDSNENIYIWTIIFVFSLLAMYITNITVKNKKIKKILLKLLKRKTR